MLKIPFHGDINWRFVHLSSLVIQMSAVFGHYAIDTYLVAKAAIAVSQSEPD